MAEKERYLELSPDLGLKIFIQSLPSRLPVSFPADLRRIAAPTFLIKRTKAAMPIQKIPAQGHRSTRRRTKESPQRGKGLPADGRT